MTLEHDLLQLARDAMRSLMTGREFAVGQTGHYLNIISRIEDELNRPQPKQQFYPDWDMLRPYHERIKELEAELAKPEYANPAAQHWHDLYYAKCKDFQDQQARLGAEIVALEEELEELKEEQPEQEPDMPTKIVGPNLEQILNAAGFYRREWVALTHADLMKEFGYTDELLRDTAYRVAKILEARNT